MICRLGPEGIEREDPAGVGWEPTGPSMIEDLEKLEWV
jgi:hypothetical protein